MVREFNFDDGTSSACLVVTPNGALEVLATHKYTEKVFCVYPQNTVKTLTALRDWCNQVLAQSEPKRVSWEAMEELVQRPEMQGKTALALQAILREEQQSRFEAAAKLAEHIAKECE